MLEGGNRTVGVGEGGLEMGENLRRRRMRGFRRQLGGWAAPQQCRADLALAVVEAFPDALPGPVTQMAGGGADRRGNAAGHGALEEPPQAAGGQAEPSDFVRVPDAESPPATVTFVAVAAKDPPRPDRLALGVALVIAVQKAVPNQRADNPAVRARRLLEPLSDRIPFLGAAAKPSLLAHADHRKIMILPARRRGGVVAGYDKNLLGGVAG